MIFRLPIILTAVFIIACSPLPKNEVVVATPTAITIRSSSLSAPDKQAEAHCRQYGKKAVARGGVKLGSPAYATLYGYDCVTP